ncbi:MAG: hypothetical protein QGI09_00325 [Dehalococcoidia bacterium]|nr:hypothetical protein [Dehalococcoidia bacterium]
MIAEKGSAQCCIIIWDLLGAERPRPRLRDHSPSHLSNAELLAVILRTDTPSESVLSLSGRLLAQCGRLAELARTNCDGLKRVHGLGEAKTTQLKTTLELGSLSIPLGK